MHICTVFLHIIIVFERCTYESALGVSFEARHGERFVDPETCSLCLCNNGEAEFCVPANRSRNLCNRLNPGPAQDRTCRLEGETLDDDETVQVRNDYPYTGEENVVGYNIALSLSVTCLVGLPRLYS